MSNPLRTIFAESEMINKHIQWNYSVREVLEDILRDCRSDHADAPWLPETRINQIQKLLDCWSIEVDNSDAI